MKAQTSQPESLPTRLIQYGLLILVALMPFHAFLSVWLGSIFGYQAWFQGWKEVLVAVLCVLSVVLIAREPARRSRLKQPWVIAFAAFTLLALIITFVAQRDVIQALLGFKINIEFLIAAVIATLVTSPRFAGKLVHVAIIGGLIVVGFAIMQRYVLPFNFLTHFGYGPDTILPYLELSATSNTPRFGATLGGPNQLGTYLILIAALVLAAGVARRAWQLWLGLPLVALASFGTYSRSAWIGLVAAITALAVMLTPRRRRGLVVVGLMISGLAGLAVIAAALPTNTHLQQSIYHASPDTHDDPMSSDSLHALSLTDSLSITADEPWGHGLGSAGPATFHSGDIFIIENQFLQLAYEVGWLGLAIFIAGLILIVKKLIASKTHHEYALATAAAIAGIAIAGMFLPTFVDSTTVLVTFTLAGALVGLHLSKQTSPRHV